MIEERDLPNREKFRKLGEKKNYKHLGTLVVDTIKYAEIKEKNYKRIPQENEKTTRKPTTLEKSQHDKNL